MRPSFLCVGTGGRVALSVGPTELSYFARSTC